MWLAMKDLLPIFLLFLRGVLSSESSSNQKAPPGVTGNPLKVPLDGEDPSEDLVAEDSFPRQIILPPPPPLSDVRLVEGNSRWRGVPVPSYGANWNHRPSNPIARFEQQRGFPPGHDARFLYSPTNEDPLYQINQHYPTANKDGVYFQQDRNSKPVFDFGPPPPKSEERSKLDLASYNPYIVDSLTFSQDNLHPKLKVPLQQPQLNGQTDGQVPHRNPASQDLDYHHQRGSDPASNQNHNAHPQYDQTDSLATLLAGAAVLNHPLNLTIDQNPADNSRQHDPDYYQDYPAGEHAYYDALYDEFLDMYYDANLNEDGPIHSTGTIDFRNKTQESKNPTQQSEIQTTLNPKFAEENSASLSKSLETGRTEDPSIDSDNGPQNISPLVLEQHPTDAPTIQRIPTSSPGITSPRPTPPSLKRDSKEVIKVSETLSLSEVLEKIGMKLPAFLSSIKEYGITLGEFTVLLRGKELKDKDLKLIQGDVGNLLAFLRGSDLKPPATQSTTTLSTSSTEGTPIQARSEETESKPSRGQPLSLSEVLQKIGVKLPIFLASLKDHQTNLGEITNLLKTTPLQDQDLKRINGQIGNLLALLHERNKVQTSNESPKTQTKLAISTTPMPKPTSSSTFSSQTVSNQPTIRSSSTTETSPQEQEQEKVPRLPADRPKPPLTPLIFGARPAILEFNNKNPTNQSSDKDANGSPSSEKNKSNLKLDIITLLKEKNLTPEDVLHDFKNIFNISLPASESKSKGDKDRKQAKPINPDARDRIGNRYKNRKEIKSDEPRPYRPIGYEGSRGYLEHRGLVNSRLSSTARPTFRPRYSPRPYSPSSSDGKKEGTESTTPKDRAKLFNKKKYYEDLSKSQAKTPLSSGQMDIATKSAIMAAGILGSVALSVFIAIFVVVKYKGYTHRRKRRSPLSLNSDSSTSSMPPLYAGRNSVCRSSYRTTNGFWNSLKRKFDPYSLSSSGTSM